MLPIAEHEGAKEQRDDEVTRNPGRETMSRGKTKGKPNWSYNFWPWDTANLRRYRMKKAGEINIPTTFLVFPTGRTQFKAGRQWSPADAVPLSLRAHRGR